MLAVVAIFAWEKHYEREKNDKLHEFFYPKIAERKKDHCILESDINYGYE